MHKYSAWLVALKEKIVNFDIKPQKSTINDLFVKAQLAFEQHDHKLAERLLSKILACNHSHIDALYALSELKFMQGRYKDSARLLQRLLRYVPNDLALHKNLLHLGIYLGNKSLSAKALKQVLELDPDDYTAVHLFNSLHRKNTAIAPQQYIVALFNNYANHFEAALVDKLRYKAHVFLAKYITKKINIDSPINTVLDLGCGTGLLGQELSKTLVINNLIGIDLAAKMLAECRDKDIYSVLHESEMLDYLYNNDVLADLIVSSDVLIYVGNLEPVFDSVHKRLKSGGYFGFTVEKRLFGTYSLDISGRYKHSLGYLKSLYKKYQFSKIYIQTIDLRLEYGNMVQGYLVLLQK